MGEKKLRDPGKDQEYELFRRVCKKGQDPVLTILRVHLLTEYYLERLLHIWLPRGDKLIEEGILSYFQKLVLVSTFDVINDKTIQCLKGLNKVRNQCAHSIEKEISMSEVEIIGRPLGDICAKYRNESKGSVKAFLYEVLSYVCGYLAGQVMMVEEDKIEKGEKRRKKVMETVLNSAGDSGRVDPKKPRG